MGTVSFDEQKERILADRRRQAMDWWGLSDADVLALPPTELLRKAVGLDARKAYEFNRVSEKPGEVAELRPALPGGWAGGPSDPDGTV